MCWNHTSLRRGILGWWLFVRNADWLGRDATNIQHTFTFICPRPTADTALMDTLYANYLKRTPRQCSTRFELSQNRRPQQGFCLEWQLLSRLATYLRCPRLLNKANALCVLLMGSTANCRRRVCFLHSAKQSWRVAVQHGFVSANRQWVH